MSQKESITLILEFYRVKRFFDRCWRIQWIGKKIFFRSSRSQMFLRIGVLKNFANFTGKHLRWSLFLIKLQSCSFIKKRLQRKCFPVKFAKLLRTPSVVASESWRWCANYLLKPLIHRKNSLSRSDLPKPQVVGGCKTTCLPIMAVLNQS